MFAWSFNKFRVFDLSQFRRSVCSDFFHSLRILYSRRSLFSNAYKNVHGNRVLVPFDNAGLDYDFLASYSFIGAMSLFPGYSSYLYTFLNERLESVINEIR